MSDAVRVERRGRLVDLTFDRPPLNILDRAGIEELDARLAELAADAEPQLVRLAGAGERAFSAGVAVEDHTVERIHDTLPVFHRAVRRLRDLPAVTLAVVRGHCLGGGMELALASDLVLAADDARFGQPEVALGCFPPVATALLPRRIGRGRTLELLISGRTFDAAEAERLGLAHWVVPADGLAARRDEISERLLGASRPVVRLIRRAVAAGEELEFAAALAEAERLYLDELVETEDMSEGIQAFLDKRDPHWNHG